MSTSSTTSVLLPYIRAAFPALAIETFEEERFLQHVRDAFPARRVLCLSANGILRDLTSGNILNHAAAFPLAFSTTSAAPETLLICFDWQHLARNAVAYRALKDELPALKLGGCCVLLVAPAWKLPPELEHDVPVIPWALPTRPELGTALSVVAESLPYPVAPDVESACLDAAAGLTLQEAENAFALSLVEAGTLDARRVEEEKMRLVRQSGFLEVWPPVPPERVGGLQGIKGYFLHEVLPSRDDAELRVRGLLTVGVPGTGKSLLAKAAGALLGWPILRLDIGALKGSLVGQSEANMRTALRLADAVAPAIILIDEIEKGIGGYQSSAHTDSGVTLGMVGTLLTWMQEHTSPVLVVATANDYHALPAELTRAGRFDEKFFVDLPTPGERADIAAIHLVRFGCALSREAAQEQAMLIAELTPDWTGAEIEQLVKSAARRSNRQLNEDLLRLGAQEIKPLARVREDEIAKLRRWAHDTLRLANTPSALPTASILPRVPLHRNGVIQVHGLSNN